MILVLVIIRMLRCPKCGWSTRVEKQGPHVVQICMCGLNKVLAMEADGMKMVRSPAIEGAFTLPGKGTQLSKILGCLATLGTLDSRTISARLGITMDKATTNLSVLRSRGLIRATGVSDVKSNGSIWILEPAVKKHYQER